MGSPTVTLKLIERCDVLSLFLPGHFLETCSATISVGTIRPSFPRVRYSPSSNAWRRPPRRGSPPFFRSDRFGSPRPSSGEERNEGRLSIDVTGSILLYPISENVAYLSEEMYAAEEAERIRRRGSNQSSDSSRSTVSSLTGANTLNISHCSF